MSNRGNTKKRRVGGGGTGVSADNGGESGGGSAELIAIKSMMQELVQQNRTQTDMINNMQGKINNMQAEITQLSKKCMSQNSTQTTMMQNMQGDITRLTKKSDTMETTIKSVKLSQGKSLAAINSRFDEVNDKLKYHEIILQNQGWKYSAPRPSTEYWSTFDEDEETEAEDFLTQIQQCTGEMRYGTGNGEIQIQADLPYNEALLPHWKEFANALKQYHYHLKHSAELQGNSSLYLLDIDLPDEVVDLLSKALESTHFQTIALRNNDLGQRGIDFALNYFKSNQTLNAFYLQGNPINNMDDINKLCKIVMTHPSIENLTLNRCIGPDINGFEMLTRIMNAGESKLSVITLSHNQISTEGGTFISDFFATDPILSTLHLDGNKLNDRDALVIAEALKHNTKLRFLSLTNNNITKTGWKALRKAEFDDTSLNAASESNHICVIRYPPDSSVEIKGLDINEMNGKRDCTMAFASKRVRQKKIYSILSSRNRDCSNVGNFEDFPVKLLPKMLSSIHAYSHYQDDVISQVRGHVQPLSIVYELCRHWDESLAVFEALSS